jgi:hypothetical protein
MKIADPDQSFPRGKFVGTSTRPWPVSATPSPADSFQRPEQAKRLRID